MIEQAIRAYLAGQASITNLISTRIYYVTAPQLSAQSTDAYLVIQKVSLSPSHVFGGDSGHNQARIQLTAVAKTYAESKAIITAIKALFKSYVYGTDTKMGSVLWVQAVNIDNEIDLPFGIDDERFATILDCIFFFKE